ncbi:MAG: cache domain-containing protein [Chloroflexota bacterium]
MVIIVTGNGVFTFVGIRLISNRIVSEAQEQVKNDLNSAREIYLGTLRHVDDIVRLTARRPLIQDYLDGGSTEVTINDLRNLIYTEGIDLLTLTDVSGHVVLRTSNPTVIGDDASDNIMVSSVLETRRSVSRTTIISYDDLILESPLLAERAYLSFVDTPMARERPETEQTAGMLLMTAAPVFNAQQQFIGVLYGGILLNRYYQIVDRIKETVFLGLTYEGHDIGTATLFQDDVRISTNVKNQDGTRAIGTRLSEEVYNQVVLDGEPWIGRAYVVNNWYITAYEPIRDINDDVIGVLYVGILEQKYVDIKNQSVLAFSTISVAAILLSITLSIYISRSISIPVSKLVSASKELANGNLDIHVNINTNDEIGELAETFNSMAAKLQERDEKLKEYTRKKIMESEKLALIGQLAANVAHELNNPLQGIVTYSHLLLEQKTCDEPTNQNLQKIVTQANRCRDIIRGLLDFSRQRKPDKTLTNVNSLLNDCISLFENQALFHNVKIQMNLEEKLPLIVIDPSQVERVFINLIVNASEAMDGVGKLTMSTKHDPVEKWVEVNISDTGQGIIEENIEKIFDPFFTTKETGRGVGLGLAISYGIIKEHKGTIIVDSEVGVGTRFTIRLPTETQISGEDDEH